MSYLKFICKKEDGIEVPDEIERFLYDIFEVYEIRGQVGFDNAVKFEIRPNEGKHYNPHVHASYSGITISIDINTLECKGNLPKNKQKSAVKWIINNRDKLLNDWNNIVITKNLPLTKSNLNISIDNI